MSAKEANRRRLEIYKRVSDLDNYLFMIYLRAFIKETIRRKVDIKAVKKQVKVEIEIDRRRSG